MTLTCCCIFFRTEAKNNLKKDMPTCRKCIKVYSLKNRPKIFDDFLGGNFGYNFPKSFPSFFEEKNASQKTA